MTKHVAISEAQAQFDKLVAEIEATGEDVIFTRSGRSVVRLVREPHMAASGEMTPAEIEQRKQAIKNLTELRKKLNVGATQEEIKSWIDEGRH
jgi:antitoxin (DNA-binding transcriptional repressor) of toxin-antitoxin stability system